MSNFSMSIAAGLCAPISGFLIISPQLKKLLKLWPSIEFDFGPEYKMIEKNRRTRLSVLMSVVIPLILNIIFFVISK